MTCELVDKTPFSFYPFYQDLTLNRLRVQLYITALREERQNFLLQFLALLRVRIAILTKTSSTRRKEKLKKTQLNEMCFLILWSNFYMNGII